MKTKKILAISGILLVALNLNAGNNQTTLNQTQVSKLYVAIFNRASEGEGNSYWQSQGSMADVADKMLATTDAQKYFGDALNDNKAFIEWIYKNTLNKTYSDDPDGINYWTNLLNSGKSRGEVVAALVNAIDSYAPNGDKYDPNDSVTVRAYSQFSHRVEISNYTANSIEGFPTNYKVSLGYNNYLNVTDDENSKYNSQLKIQGIANGSDSDNDGVIDSEDFFPTDPAASIDSDGDGYPDMWNSGKNEADSTSGLKIDKFPNDSSKWFSNGGGNSSSSKVISTLYSVGYLTNIAQKGNILFLASGPFEPNDGYIYIVDVSNKTNPRVLSTLKMPYWSIGDIKINPNNPNHLIVANSQRVVVVDISNVNSPSILKSFPPSMGVASCLAIKNGILYVGASQYNGADIDMYNLNNYEEVKYKDSNGNSINYIPIQGDIESIVIKDDYIFTGGSKFITVSSISSKSQITTFAKENPSLSLSNEKSMAIRGNKLYIANFYGLYVYDISSINNIHKISFIDTVQNIAVNHADSVVLSNNGSKAYIANFGGGLEIIDISNSSNPKSLESVEPKLGNGGDYTQVILSSDQNYAYAIGSKGLEIIKLNVQSDNSGNSFTSNYMDISKWKIYGTASMSNNIFNIGDNIGYDENDVDNDQNLWQRYGDDTTTNNNDYDVIVTKDSFTPPIDLKFSGTISTTSFGYNEMGISYVNDSFDSVFGHGRPLLPIATFVYRWEAGNTLNLFVNGQGYISTTLSPLIGNFELKWDGSIVKFYYNNQLVAQKPLSYIQGKKVSIFFKNFEKSFKLNGLYISGTKASTQADTTTIGNTVWVNKEPDGEFNYAQAKVYCENLGYRLPTGAELVAAWNFYGGVRSPPGFKKGTFYWGSQGEWCAMDNDCSTAEVGPLDGFGHPKCVVK